MKKIDEKEAEEIKKVYKHYLDKRKEMRKNTSFKVEDFFGNVISKNNFSQEQIAKLNVFFNQNNVSKNFSINIIFFKPKREKNIDYQPSAPPCYEKIISVYMTKTRCLGGRHYNNTINISQYEKRNPNTKKLLKIIKGTCSICGRKKSQILSE